MTKLTLLPLTTLATAIRNGEISPVELTEEYLENIGRWRELNSYATVFTKESLEAARRAEKAVREKRKLGPLHGVPIGIKDVIDVKGYPTTMACKAFRDNVAREDSTIVKRLRQAGAIIIGKHNSSELAMGATGEESYFGPTRNPWDTERVSGGSSSGSAAAVAAGLCAGAIGTDATGSVRIPAAWCGVVGLKPTFGRLSKAGEGIGGWSISHPGILARRVADVALILGAIAGYDRRDPFSADKPVPNYAREMQSGVRGMKVGVPHEYFFDGMDASVERRVYGAIEKLEELGAKTVEIKVPLAKYARSATLVLAACELAQALEPYLQRRGADFNPFVKARIELGRLIFATDYLRAQRIRTIITRSLAESMRNVDLLAVPTTPIVATKLKQREVEIKRRSVSVRLILARFTTMFNLVGFPAANIPCGFDPDGLPVGFQLVAKPFKEGQLLRAANDYESHTRWRERAPTL